MIRAVYPVAEFASELAEARMLLRWASAELNATERLAIDALLRELPDSLVAEKAGISRSAIWGAKQTALSKMRRRLAMLRIRSSAQLISSFRGMYLRC